MAGCRRTMSARSNKTNAIFAFSRPGVDAGACPRGCLFRLSRAAIAECLGTRLRGRDAARGVVFTPPRRQSNFAEGAASRRVLLSGCANCLQFDAFARAQPQPVFAA
jgi:hypothetical protein